MSQYNEGRKTFTAGEALAEHRRVKLDSTGKAVYADSEESIGVTDAAAANGAPVVVWLKNFPGTRKMVCAEAVDIGDRVYGTTDGKITDTFAGSGPTEAIALEAGSGDGAEIEVLPAEGGSELLYETLAQSAAGGTSSASEFTFSNGSFTVPAGEIKEGDLFRVTARINLPATNSTDTFTGRIKVGTETICTSPNPDAENGDQCIMVADVTVRAAGASGSLEGVGYVLNDALAAGLAVPFGKAAASEDLSGAVAIVVTGQFSASSAGNEARLEHFTIERIRK